MSVTDFEGIARFAQVQGCPSLCGGGAGDALGDGD